MSSSNHLRLHEPNSKGENLSTSFCVNIATTDQNSNFLSLKERPNQLLSDLSQWLWYQGVQLFSLLFGNFYCLTDFLRKLALCNPIMLLGWGRMPNIFSELIEQNCFWQNMLQIVVEHVIIFVTCSNILYKRGF